MRRRIRLTRGAALLLASAVCFVIAFTVLQVVRHDVKPAGAATPPLVGGQDNQPKVLGQVKNWRGLVHLVDDTPGYDWYKTCFTNLTGHSWQEAEDAAVKEAKGWNLRVTIVSNTSVSAVREAYGKFGVSIDSDIVEKHGFQNTRGLPSNKCEPFQDPRSQGRFALTLPGKDKRTPGLPVVLTHCGNILPQPGAPSTPPSQSPNQPRPPGSTPPGSPSTVPPTTPTSTPTSVKNCRGVDPDPNTATKLCDSNYISRPVVTYRTDPGRTAGATEGGATRTQQQQAPSDTPDPKTGSRLGSKTPTPSTNPITTTPDTGQTTGDPCHGDPNCGG